MRVCVCVCVCVRVFVCLLLIWDFNLYYNSSHLAAIVIIRISL